MTEYVSFLDQVGSMAQAEMEAAATQGNWRSPAAEGNQGRF